MADFCKIASVTSLTPETESNLSKDFPPSVPRLKAPKGSIRRPRKAPPVTNIINPKPVTFQVDDFNDFKLHPRAKGSFMFVSWNILRHFIKTKKVCIVHVQ